MDYLFLLQFACFLFMLFCALVLCITRLHVKWLNQRYEWSRWLIFTALIGLAMHFLMQMFLGFRARGDVMGAIINMLVYPPCYSLIAMGIYNRGNACQPLEDEHRLRWHLRRHTDSLRHWLRTERFVAIIWYGQRKNGEILGWLIDLM